MKLLHRLGYYFGGFAIGLIFLAFFLNGKRVSCDYGPQARVIKNLNSKPVVFSDMVKKEIDTDDLDSLTILSVLKNGKVLFSESDTRKEPCGEYIIEKYLEDKSAIRLVVQNCDSLTTILKASQN